MVSYSHAECARRLGKKYPKTDVCGTKHCNYQNATEEVQSDCNSKDPYERVTSMQLVDKQTGAPFTGFEWYWDADKVDKALNDAYATKKYKWKGCNCCCGCYAYGTPIAQPEGFTAIEELRVGDEILSGSVTSGGSGVQMSWGVATLQFSYGTGPADRRHNPPMVYISYDDDEEPELITTVDQLFLMPSGRMKRADQLRVGDELILADPKGGTTTAVINVIAIGEYAGGIHHIATTSEFNGSLDGHLINSHGVVTGDYTLQVHQNDLEALGLIEGNDQAPLGHPEYEGEQADHQADMHHYVRPGHDGRAAVHELIKLYKYNDDAPTDARSFISSEQAQEVLNHPEYSLLPITSTAGRGDLRYLATIYQGFYSDIEFDVDWPNNTPNAYAFEDEAGKHILITGGLVRSDCINYAGLAVILGTMVGYFYGQGPYDDSDYVLPGAAHRSGIGHILRSTWDMFWDELAADGFEQVNELFSYAENADETSQSVQAPPTTYLRRSLRSGMLNTPLPAYSES